jgi:chromosome partitioning protein
MDNLSVKEIAIRLKLDESSVRRKIHAKEIPAVKKSKSFFSTERALEYFSFIEEQKKALQKMTREPITISVVNHKGGCSKTTTAYTLAGLLVELGNKVLVVDTDPQGNCSQTSLESVMTEDDIVLPFENTIKDILLEKKRNGSLSKETISKSIRPSLFGYDIIPCDLTLNSILQEIETSSFKEVLLKESFKEFENDYDYIIIDTPPSLGFSMIAPLTASDYVILVTTPDPYSIIGIEQTLDVINSVKRQNSVLSNPKKTDVLGIVISRVKGGTKVAKHFIEELTNFAQTLSIRVFPEVIAENIKIPETQALQRLITEYDPLSLTSLAYFNISLAVDESIKKARLKAKL